MNLTVGQEIPEWTTIGGGENSFPNEYAVSGWWKWRGPYTAEYHSLFRFTNIPRVDN